MQILFVIGDKDAEEIKSKISPLSVDWDIDFAHTGRQALARLAQASFEIIAVDMHLSDMEGVSLLKRVEHSSPHLIRFALLNDTDDEKMLRASTPAHQFIFKRSSVEVLRNTIERTIAIRRLLSNEALQQLVLKIHTLPGLPDIYLRLAQALRSPNTSLASVGKIIESDPALCAKMLQMVNSAYYCLPQRVSNPRYAVSLLGIDAVQSIILLNNVFTQFDYIKALIPEFSMEAFQRHCLAVSGLARALAKKHHLPGNVIDDVTTAGLLHDIGKLVLIQSFPKEYLQVLHLATECQIHIDAAERKVFGISHAEIGAYLLGIWGLADPIIEACAFHQDPQRGRQLGFGSIASIHIADILDQEYHAAEVIGSLPGLDMDYLQQMDNQEILPDYGEISRALFRETEGSEQTETMMPLKIKTKLTPDAIPPSGDQVDDSAVIAISSEMLPPTRKPLFWWLFWWRK